MSEVKPIGDVALAQIVEQVEQAWAGYLTVEAKRLIARLRVAEAARDRLRNALAPLLYLAEHEDASGWFGEGGRYYPEVGKWYYSGTNERSQWAQVEGDEPTHWMPLPAPPEYTP